VRAIGVGMNQSRIPTRFVRETDIDVVLVAGRFSVLEQGALDDLLPAAEARGVSVVIGGVFNSGLLASPPRHAMYNYAPAPQPVVERALRLESICRQYDVPLPAAAIRFPFSHPSVATVLTGARSIAELDATLAALARPVPADLWLHLCTAGLVPEQLLPALRALG
jgi:D-threo-aldose 1-dehydrogenase